MIIIKAAINCPNGVIGAISPYPTVVKVTIHQYIPSGILVNPLSSGSIIYINVPQIIHITKTLKIKTPTFALLDINAFIKMFDSPINLVIFKILNTLNSLRALNATKDCEPTNKSDKYFGIVDKRSIIP